MAPFAVVPSCRTGVIRALLVLLVPVLLLTTACSDDPILGPTEDDSTDNGGSYSNIKRLAPPDTSANTESSFFAPMAPNPERF